jgi:hypothetical protein
MSLSTDHLPAKYERFFTSGAGFVHRRTASVPSTRMSP